jgi:mRNA interferase MazF
MAGVSFPRRGEVYLTDLDPTVGTEIATTRPVLIISNDTGNEFSRRVIVAPITSKGVERVYPFEVFVPHGEGGLSRPSKIVFDQIRTLDKRRLGPRLGTISTERMVLVGDAIRLSLAV